MGAIFLWGSLAPLGVSLQHVPPFLLTGLGLIIGSFIAIPLGGVRLLKYQPPWKTLLLGVYGLFGFHLLLFIALQNAPPVQANLVNYLWPLGMVLLAPLFLVQARLRLTHLLAGGLGFCGAALAITQGNAWQGSFSWGYVAALGSAFIWATYSLATQRVAPFPTATIGWFGLASGLLSLFCHALWEPAVTLGVDDWWRIVVLGAGPLGGAFYLWDAALKHGDARQIGLLSFSTPLLSTLALLWQRGEFPHYSVVAGGFLIILAAIIGSASRTNVAENL
jgi:drug/metabolite transporter (DMT)-like permease